MQNEKIYQTKFGQASDALSLISETLSPCSTGLIRVHLKARTINPSDILSVFGEGQYKYNHVPPRVPGFEGVGIVVESYIDGYEKGDRVLVAREGCWQRYIDVEEFDLFKIPEYIDSHYAAQLYINPLTSWLLIQSYVKASERPVIALNAANSTMGRLMLQLLEKLNLESIVITSQANADELHALGASYVLNANQPLTEQVDALTIPRPDLVLDAVGGDAATELVRALSHDGTYVIYGCFSMKGHDA